MRKRDEADVAWVGRFIVSPLRWSATPLTRDQLTERVLDHAWNNFGVKWQRTTAARRVRDGLELLLDGDQPVISAGHGYKLAAEATAEEREHAAQLADVVGTFRQPTFWSHESTVQSAPSSHAIESWTQPPAAREQ